LHYVRRVEPNGNSLSVVLADDHHFFREGLRGMLESVGVSIVGEAMDGTEAVALAGRLEPDVVAIDLNMPDAGVETLRRIVLASPETRLVVLSSSAEGSEVLGALKAGASGFLLKDARADELVEGIRQTSDQVLLSRKLAHALLDRLDSRSGDGFQSAAVNDGPALTTRELDVMRLIVLGADNASIGLELSISRHTVKQHVTNIFEKLGVRSRVEAAVYAVQTGLVQAPIRRDLRVAKR
jgi:DNA-binding NarL/FixJ family response regulator